MHIDAGIVENWSALYVDKIVYYGCETSEIISI